MKESAVYMKLRRRKFKDFLVSIMGRGCQICGYLKCNRSLCFHHLDPDQKDFSMGEHSANPENWANVFNEINKCIMLCTNCHIELHSGITCLPEIFHKIAPIYADILQFKLWVKSSNLASSSASCISP